MSLQTELHFNSYFVRQCPYMGTLIEGRHRNPFLTFQPIFFFLKVSEKVSDWVVRYSRHSRELIEQRKQVYIVSNDAVFGGRGFLYRLAEKNSKNLFGIYGLFA